MTRDISKLCSDEEFKEAVVNSTSKQQLAKRLGFSFYNGKIAKILERLSELYSVPLEETIAEAKKKLSFSKRKYERVIKNCPICNKEFEAQLGHPKEKTTCSYSCSNTYQPKQNADSKKKTSETLKKFWIDNPDVKERLRKQARGSFLSRNNLKKDKSAYYSIVVLEECFTCGKDFAKKERNRVNCSTECNALYRESDVYRDKLCAAAQKRIAEGRHKGWASRDKVNRSFPEQYIETILEKEFGIIKNKDYQPELKQGRWFIDFAFVERKLALEIDGKQHEYPERKASDIEKDKFLVEQGWSVHRIKWQRVKTKEDREAVISTLKKILE